MIRQRWKQNNVEKGGLPDSASDDAGAWIPDAIAKGCTAARVARVARVVGPFPVASTKISG